MSSGGGVFNARVGEEVVTGDCCGFGSHALVAISDASATEILLAAKKYELSGAVAGCSAA